MTEKEKKEITESISACIQLFQVDEAAERIVAFVDDWSKIKSEQAVASARIQILSENFKQSNND
jgi:hypothetical protein